MDEAPALRASDAERDAVVSRVRGHMVEGRLTVDEFAERLDLIYRARTRDELERLTADLPAEGALPERKGRRARHFVIAVFAGASRRGRWRVGSHVFSFAVFGGVEIDLREAELTSDEVTITALTLFGGTDIRVPERLESELMGIALFGGNTERGQDEPVPGAPLVRVRALTIFGGLELRRVGPRTKDSFLRALRRRVDAELNR